MKMTISSAKIISALLKELQEYFFILLKVNLSTMRQELGLLYMGQTFLATTKLLYKIGYNGFWTTQRISVLVRLTYCLRFLRKETWI